MVGKDLEGTVWTCKHQLQDFLTLYRTDPVKADSQYSGMYEDLVANMERCTECASAIDGLDEKFFMEVLMWLVSTKPKDPDYKNSNLQ